MNGQGNGVKKSSCEEACQAALSASVLSGSSKTPCRLILTLTINLQKISYRLSVFRFLAHSVDETRCGRFLGWS